MVISAGSTVTSSERTSLITTFPLPPTHTFKTTLSDSALFFFLAVCLLLHHMLPFYFYLPPRKLHENKKASGLAAEILTLSNVRHLVGADR